MYVCMSLHMYMWCVFVYVIRSLLTCPLPSLKSCFVWVFSFTLSHYLSHYVISLFMQLFCTIFTFSVLFSFKINLRNIQFSIEATIWMIKKDTPNVLRIISANSNWQSFTKYLRQTVVFMLNSALWENSNFYFAGDFCKYSRNFHFGRRTKH